jgi:hypothetical protein
VGTLPGDIADADPDADGDARNVGAPAGSLDPLLDRHRGGHGVGRAGKRRHDAVAEVVVERAVVLRDRLGQQPVKCLPVRLGPLLPELRPQRRRADEVAEEDRGRAGPAFGGLRGHRRNV